MCFVSWFCRYQCEEWQKPNFVGTIAFDRLEIDPNEIAILYCNCHYHLKSIWDVWSLHAFANETVRETCTLSIWNRHLMCMREWLFLFLVVVQFAYLCLFRGYFWIYISYLCANIWVALWVLSLEFLIFVASAFVTISIFSIRCNCSLASFSQFFSVLFLLLFYFSLILHFVVLLASWFCMSFLF